MHEKNSSSPEPNNTILEETLAEQRERIVRSILSPERLAERELFRLKYGKQAKPKQLTLFP